MKQFKWSLEIYKQSGMNYAELQSTFKKVASVLNSRPVSARYGPKHLETDPDYLEMITPNMLLTARSGVDLPAREYKDEDSPSKRLAYRQELENSWWEQWKVQCFDSLLPTQSWTQKKRGVKPGDVVLISYSDKSKTGTFRLGRVESVEHDEDQLVRTCVVQYRIVRADLPVEEMRLYFKGLKFKKIRVPVQRLCIILPIEEQELGTADLSNLEIAVDSEVVRATQVPIPDHNSETEEHDEEDPRQDNVEELKNNYEETEQEETEDVTMDDFEEVQLNDDKQVDARNYLVKCHRENIGRKVKVMKTNRTVRNLHKNFSLFESLVWMDSTVEDLEKHFASYEKLLKNMRNLGRI